MDMEEDASHMPKESWTLVHGTSNVGIWNRVQQDQQIIFLERDSDDSKKKKKSV
jgi:hypothetical protein